jgi:hypothetical protein
MTFPQPLQVLLKVSKLFEHRFGNLPWPLFSKEGKCLPLEKGGWEGFSMVQSILF